MAEQDQDKGDARLVSLPSGTLAAIIFLFVAMIGFIAVVAMGTGKMPKSGNEPHPANQVGAPLSNE